MAQRDDKLKRHEALKRTPAKDVGVTLKDEVKERADAHRRFATESEATQRTLYEALIRQRPEVARALPRKLAQDARRRAKNHYTRAAVLKMEVDEGHPEFRAMYIEAVYWHIAVMRYADIVEGIAQDLARVSLKDLVALRKGWDAIDVALQQIAFHLRDYISNPVVPGMQDTLAMELSGLVETKITLLPDLTRALSSGGANPHEEKLRQLPAAVFEKALEPEEGEDLRRFTNRVAWRLQRLGEADTSRREIMVVTEVCDGNPVKRRVSVPREVPLGDDNDEGAQPHMTHHAKRLSTPSDQTSVTTLNGLELHEVFERAKPTARQLDITLRREIDKEPAEQIAEEYSVKPSTIYNTVAQTQGKFRTAREVMARPKK